MRPWPVRLESLALAQLEGCHMADDLQGRRGRRRDQGPHASAGLLPPQPPAPRASGARGVQPRGLQEQGVGRWPVIPSSSQPCCQSLFCSSSSITSHFCVVVRLCFVGSSCGVCHVWAVQVSSEFFRFSARKNFVNCRNCGITAGASCNCRN